MPPLFEQGRWEELEDFLRSNLRQDANDARSAFRLANLLSLAERWEEALHFYDVAWTQRWPGAVCLNNQGAALARAGHARAALEALQKALELDADNGPAAYNLGILLDRLGDEDSPPELVDELGFTREGQNARTRAEEEFHRATGAVDWGGERPAINGPLYLWTEDLQSGFGFEPTARAADMEEADQYLREGLARLDAGDWQAAIDSLTAAATLHPPLAARVARHLTRARLALGREYRQAARRRKMAGDYEGARAALETYYRMATSLPDRDLAEELLLEEIRNLGEQLRLREPSPDWRELQALISNVRQRVNDLTQGLGEPEIERGEVSQAEVEGSGGDDERTPPKDVEGSGDHETGSDGGTSSGGRRVGAPHPGRILPRVATADHLRALCRDAWGRQVRYLISSEQFDQAELMLDFSELQWFAQDDLPRWRRELYTAKAEALSSDGIAAQSSGEPERAVDLFHEARVAAMEAGDAILADRIDRQLEHLQQREERRDHLQEIEDLLGRGELLEVLRLSTELLAADPEQATLRSRRENALIRLRDRIEDAIQARQWELAHMTAMATLTIIPDFEDIRQLASQAREGLLGQLVRQGENALAVRDFDTAEERLRIVLDLAPDHRPALELRKRLEVEKKVDPDVADEKFVAALVDFRQARAAAEPREALEHLFRLRELDPDSPETREAQQWTASALVGRWRTELARDRSRKALARVESELLALLGVVPSHREAVEFREELRRIDADDYWDAKRTKGIEQLEAVKEKLLALEPAAALDLLEPVADRGDPRLEPDVETYLSEALDQIRRRVERLHRLETLAPEQEAELSALVTTCRRWAPSKAREIEAEIAQRQAEPERRERIDRDYREIETSVEGQSSPLAGLKALYRASLDKHRSGSEVVVAKRGDLLALRRRLRARLGCWGRWRATRFERTHPVRALLEGDEKVREDR